MASAIFIDANIPVYASGRDTRAFLRQSGHWSQASRSS